MSIAVKLKYEEFPLVIPNFEDLKAKFDSLLGEISKHPDDVNLTVDAITRMGEFFDEIETDSTIITTRHSIDTTNEEYKKANAVMDEIGPMIQGLANEYAKTVLNLSNRGELIKRFGKFFFDKLELSLQAFDPIIIEDLQTENKLTTEYDNLIASAKIEFNGEEYNLSTMQKFLEDSDREVRRSASKKIEDWMREHDSTISEIYSKLVTVRTEMAKKLGYSSFTEMAYARMGRTDWNSADARNYRHQIRQSVVPISVKIVENQMARTGVTDPLFYDLPVVFNDGNPTPKGGKDYLVNAAMEMYDEMGSEIGQFFKELVELNLMDLEAKPGKMTGGYMTYFPRYKMPFIFSNFNGTSGDVDVLTHEIGHAFQGYMSRDIKPREYRDPTMEEAEIHSMSMEFFAGPWVDKFFKEDSAKYLLAHLEETINFLPYGATVDAFQHWVYDNPNATHEERCSAWLALEKRFTPYKNYGDFDYFGKGTRWMRQLHIFRLPFYYIEYTLAQVVALQFLSLMKEDYKSAWEKYVKVCSSGGKYPFSQLLNEADLLNPFFSGSIERTIVPVIKILEDYRSQYQEYRDQYLLKS